jgi:hypothetical protein
MKPTKLLVESKAYNLLSSPLKEQLSNRTPLYKTFKFNDKRSIEILKEARKLYSRNLIILNETDINLVKSDIGSVADYEANQVNLDIPSTENPIDTITMDIPLFIRMLEYAREDAKTDMDLHDVTEKAISMGENGEILTMDNYEDIVGKELKESVYLYHKNPNTKQVTKYNFNIYEQKINMNRVRKLIYEALNKRPLKHNIETTIETEDGIEFEVSGYLYDEEGPVYDLKIVPNSYDEFDEEEIQKYFNSHQDKIENKLIEQYLQDQTPN